MAVGRSVELEKSAFRECYCMRELLGFRHPISKKWEEFFIGMPAEMEVVLEKLKLKSG